MTWLFILQLLQPKIFDYVKTVDLINLCYVSKKMRTMVLKNFKHIFDLSTGFCSVTYWNNLIEKNCFAICYDIFYNKHYRDEKFINFNFDFDLINLSLLKKFRHFSLFSICLHFLKCIKCCDKQAQCCKVCSRIIGGYCYNCNFFSNMCIGKTRLDLGFCYDMHVDLDIYLYNACKILGGWTSDSNWCSFHKNFRFAADLFRAFCSVFFRVYLN